LSRKPNRACAAFWLGIFLLLQAMVVFPGLHEMIHSDAGHEDHHCAVTLFTHGQVHGADAELPVFRPEPVAVFVQARPETPSVSPDLRLLPGRGPPSFPSLHG
jgi:hypothetical protein